MAKALAKIDMWAGQYRLFDNGGRVKLPKAAVECGRFAPVFEGTAEEVFRRLGWSGKGRRQRKFLEANKGRRVLYCAGTIHVLEREAAGEEA